MNGLVMLRFKKRSCHLMLYIGKHPITGFDKFQRVSETIANAENSCPYFKKRLFVKNQKEAYCKNCKHCKEDDAYQNYDYLY